MKLDTFEKLNAAFESAQEKWLQGDLLAAYDDLREILTYRLLHTKLIDADLKVIQSLADLAGLLGEFQQADNLLYSAITMYENAKSKYWADYTRLRRTQLCLDQGNLYQGKKILQEMAPRIGDIENIQFSPSGLLQWEEGCVWRNTTPQDRTVLFAELYLVMGRLLTALGQYGEALNALKQGLFHAEGENAPDLGRQTILPLKLTVASVFLENGHFEDAHSYFSHLQDQVNLPQHPEYFIRWLELSGKLNLLQGNLGAGLKKFQQVAKKCHQIRLQRAVLRSDLNLAHILIFLNQTSTAENYLVHTESQALAIDDQALAARAKFLLQLCHARSHSSVGGSPAELAVTSMLQGESKAKDVVEEDVVKEKVKLDLSNQSPNCLAWFEDRALAFQWELSYLNLKAADALLKHIQKVFKSTDSHLIQVQIQILQGILTYYQGTENKDLNKIHQAYQILEKVCPQLETMDLKPELWQVQRFLVWCSTRLHYPPPEIEALTLSTNQLLEEMTSSLEPEDQVFYLLNKWTVDEESIAAKINQLQRIQLKLSRGIFWLRPLRYLQLIQRLNALVEHIDEYKDVLAKRTIKGETAKVLFLSSASLWLRLFHHPKDRLTLSFLILPDQVLIVKMGWFLFDFRVIPITRIAVRELVQSWYQRIDRMNKHNRDVITSGNDYTIGIASVAEIGQDIANKLADILEIPQLLGELPKHIRALTIVPDDILHGFPFAAIFYQGKYLIERYALSIAYESKGRRSPSPSNISKKEALLVGISNGKKPFYPLPGVRRELEQVNKWLCTCPLLNSSKATVVERLPQAKQFHIACHGVFELNRPERSGLVFISDSAEQEILSLRELSEMDLTGLRHATLSSCWSADHFILPGRWIISLPETLWRSGTQSILSCLWQVNDTVAVPFMNRFYEYLYLYQFPRDEALRRTQLDCLRNRLYEPIVDSKESRNHKLSIKMIKNLINQALFCPKLVDYFCASPKFRYRVTKLIRALPISRSISDRLMRYYIDSQSKGQQEFRKHHTDKPSTNRLSTDKLLFWAGFNLYGDHTTLKF